MIVEKQQQSIDQLTLNKCSDLKLPSHEKLLTSEIGCGEINCTNVSEEISKQDGKKHKISMSDNTVCGVSSPAKRARSD